MTTNWKLLPVPEQDYDELRATVNARQGERGEPSAPPAEQLRADALRRDAVVREVLTRQEPWPMEALARLAAGDFITTERFTRVMDLCVALRQTQPDFPFISTSEIEDNDGIEMTADEWRAACRRLNSHLDQHYSDVPRWPSETEWQGRHFWPLANLSGRAIGKKDELYVGITEEQAKRWKQVRQS
jgi:hypothetical protein